MRGVVAGGMVSELEERGMLHCFDSIHGSSAGACAGAYFTAGQARLGTRIFYEDINNDTFISFQRAVRGRPLLDKYYLIDHVMRAVKVLNVERIVARPGFLHVVSTEVLTGKPRVHSEFRSADFFFQVLKASISIPLVTDGPVEVEGRPLFDGAVVQPVALGSALAVGATHILVLLTQRAGELDLATGRVSGVLDLLTLRAFGYRTMAAAFRERKADIQHVRRWLRASARTRDPALAFVARPDSAMQIGRLTKDGRLLRLADTESREAVARFFDGESKQKEPFAT